MAPARPPLVEPSSRPSLAPVVLEIVPDDEPTPAIGLTTGMQTAATQDAHDLSGISATASKSCTCANGNASTCLNTDCSGSRIIESVTVNTTATVTPPYHVPLVPRSFTLTGKAVMRVHQ